MPASGFIRSIRSAAKCPTTIRKIRNMAVSVQWYNADAGQITKTICHEIICSSHVQVHSVTNQRAQHQTWPTRKLRPTRAERNTKSISSFIIDIARCSQYRVSLVVGRGEPPPWKLTCFRGSRGASSAKTFGVFVVLSISTFRNYEISFFPITRSTR